MSGDERPPATLGNLGQGPLSPDYFHDYEQALQRACLKRGIDYTQHGGETREAMFASLGRKLFRESNERWAGPRGRPTKDKDMEILLLELVSEMQLERLSAIIDRGMTDLKPLTDSEAIERIHNLDNSYKFGLFPRDKQTRLSQLSRARAKIARKSKPIKRK